MSIKIFTPTILTFFLLFTSSFGYNCKTPQQGPPGAQGETGPQGLSGDQGPQGIPGSTFSTAYCYFYVDDTTTIDIGGHNTLAGNDYYGLVGFKPNSVSDPTHANINYNNLYTANVDTQGTYITQIGVPYTGNYLYNFSATVNSSNNAFAIVKNANITHLFPNHDTLSAEVSASNVLDSAIQGSEVKITAQTGIITLNANDKISVVNVGKADATLDSNTIDTSFNHAPVLAGITLIYLGPN